MEQSLISAVGSPTETKHQNAEEKEALTIVASKLIKPKTLKLSQKRAPKELKGARASTDDLEMIEIFPAEGLDKVESEFAAYSSIKVKRPEAIKDPTSADLQLDTKSLVVAPQSPSGSPANSEFSETEKPFACKFCKRRFKFCSALGGHVSKAHPGLSEAYEHKKRVRDTRQLERDLHQEALKVFKKRQNDNEGDLNRNTIKRIKKEIVKAETKYDALLQKFNQRGD